MDGERRRRGGLSTALACLVAVLVLPSGSGDLPQPLPLDFASVGNIDSRQEVELSANLHIPDGSELTLPLNVPLERLQLDGRAPPKVVSVASTQRDGVFGVGEVIDLEVRFSSRVAVFQGPPGSPHGGWPTITLRTGCTDELCHVKEVQKAHCQADGGVFSLAFDDEKTWVSEFDQTTHNIPWDADPEAIKFHLESLTNINEVSVRYSSGRSACSTTGITIFVTFDSVNIEGDDGDLPELKVERSNEGGSTDAPAPGQPASPERPIFHATSSTIVLPTRFTEVVKGRKYSHRIAKYMSGSGTDTLRFQYVVQNGDSTERLDTRDAHALEMNGGTIVLDGTCTPTLKHTIDTDAYTMLVGGVPDGSGSGEICNGVGSCYIHYNKTITSNYSVCEGGNTASTVLPVPGSEGSFATTAPSALSFNNDIAIDVSPPTVAEVTSNKTDGTYGVGEVIDIDVVFSAPVATGGTPELQLETGDIDRYAALVAQPQPNTLQFRYTVGLGDTANDLNYMSPDALTVGRTAGGFIKRNSTNATTDAVLTLVDAGGLGSLSFSKALVVITSPPAIVEVTSGNADGTYGAGEEINITVTFDAPVVVTGTPKLPVLCGAADLYPGHFLVRAPVDGNANQLEFPNVAHGLSTAVDKGSQFTVGTQTFTIVSVSGNVVTVKEAWAQGAVAPAAFNAEGTPQLKILAPKRREAVYVAGTGTTTLTFVYTVGRGDTHVDLDLLPATEMGVPGATAVQSFPINLGQELLGTSTTGVQTASINRLSTSSSFPAALVVVEDASPLCGNVFPGQTSTGAPCKNLATRKAIVIHDAVPQVLSISSTKPDGHYGVDQVIDVQVTFDRPVAVEKLPAIKLAVVNGASNSVWAVYSSGSGTPVLVFTYKIKAGDSSADLDYTATDALTVAYQDNSYIRLMSTNPTTNAKLSPLAAPGAANSLGANKAIVIDTTVPYVTRVVADLVGGSYGAGEQVDFVVHWSAAVDVTVPSAAPYITMETGSIDQRAFYISGSGTPLLKFRYIVQPGDASPLLDYKLGTADYTQTTLIVLNGATITANAGGGAVSLALPKPLASEKTTWARNLTRTDNAIQQRFFSTGAVNSIAGTKNIVVDTAPPQVLDVFSNKADGVYGVGERIIVSVKFSAPVTASSTTKLTLETGDTDTLAPLFGGSGTDTLAFRYDVVAGHGTSQLEVTSEAALVCTDISGISVSSASDAQVTSIDRVVDVATGQKAASLFAVWVEFNGLIRRVKVSVLGSSALPQLRGTEDFSPIWASVVGATDLKKDATQDSVSPRPIAFQSKLYIMWVEQYLAATQIRAAVYGGDDSAPTWTFVDGNLAQGLNLDASQIAAEPCVAVHGGSLYAAWHERSTTGNADRVRVKQYNGNDGSPAWTRAEGAVEGLNLNFVRHARSPHLASSAGKLYAAWVEEDNTGVFQVRVSVYSGTAWARADGGGAAGLNVDPTKAAAAPRLADLGGTLFCAWHETNNLGITQVRASAYDGTTWARIDTGGASGLNADITRPAQDVQLNAFIGGAAGGRHAAAARVYLNWRELSSAGIYQQVVKSFEPTNATGAAHGTGTIRYENLSPQLSSTSAGADSASVHVLQQPAFGVAPQSYRMYSVWTEGDNGGAAPVLRAAVYSGDDDQPRWYSVTDSCLRRASTTPTTPIMRTLPSSGAVHSLSAKSKIVVDTLAPEVLSVSAHTRHMNATYTVASLVQTVDIVTHTVGGGDYAKFRLVYGVAPVGKSYSVKSPPLWTDCLAHDASANAVKTEVLAKMPGLSSLLQTVEKKDPPHSASSHFGGHRYVFTFAAGAVGIKAFGKDFTDCSVSTNKFVTDDTNNFVRVNRDTTTPLQPGILELFVRFSQPVVVDTTSGTPTLELETGVTNRQAVYTAAGTVQAVDVGVTAPGQITAGEFKLKYCPDPSTCGAAQTTKCIAWHDGQSVSASSLASRLLELDDVRVLGIESVQSTPRGNGMRFTVNFGAGEPAQLLIAPKSDLSDCEKFSSPVQTIDVSAPSAISAGGFKLQYGSLETACIDWNAADEATDGTSVKERVEAMGAGVLKVGVTKDLAHATNGHRYIVTFSSPTTSILPLVPSLTGCTTFNPNTAAVSANADIVAANVAADTLTFKYKITTGDETTKLDYTSTAALALNSGAIFRASSPSPSQAAVLTLPNVGDAQSRWLCSYCSLAASSSLAIDGRTAPAVTSVHAVLASCPGCDSVGSFGEGEVIDMLVTFNSPVVVVGQPVLRVDTGGTTKAYAARYASGSGTAVLSFTYIVQAEDFSSKLQYESLTALQLVDGAYIRRTALSGVVTPGVDADLTLPSLNRDKLGRVVSSGAPGEIVIEARASKRPTITSISSPTSDATYHVGEELDIEVTFSSEVAIVGTPQLKLSANGAGATPVGASTAERYAVYTAGGRTQIIDVGVRASAQVTGGQYKLQYGGGGLTMTTTCIDWNAPATALAPATGSSLEEKLLEIAAIKTIGIQSVARAQRGYGYRYTVVFKNGAGVQIGVAGETKHSAPLALTAVPISSVNVCAQFAGGTDAVVERPATQNILFRYIVQAGDTAADLDVSAVETANGAAVRRASQRPTTDANIAAWGSKLSDNKNIVIDTTVPTVLKVEAWTAEAAGTPSAKITTPVSYGVGLPFPGQINLHITFSTPVTLVGPTIENKKWLPAPHPLSAGPTPPWGSVDNAPTLEVATGGHITSEGVRIPNRKAVYSTGSGTNTLVFVYTVQELDQASDLTYPSPTALQLGGSGGALKATSTNPTIDAVLTLPAPGTANALGTGQDVTINDNSVPTIARITSQKPDATYGAGEQIDIEVIFSKRVRISTGLNKDKTKDARAPVSAEMGGKLYTLWSEKGSANLYEVRAVVGNAVNFLGQSVAGTPTPAWKFVDGAALQDPSRDALFPSVAVKDAASAADSKLYAAWTESDSNGHRVRIAAYGGNDNAPAWTYVDTGINAVAARNPRNPHIVGWGSRIVAAWEELGGNGLSQIRVALYNGDDSNPAWSFMDSGSLNRNAARNAHRPHLVVFNRGMASTARIYCTWTESDGLNNQVRVRELNYSPGRAIWTFFDGGAAGGLNVDRNMSASDPSLFVSQWGTDQAQLWLAWNEGNASCVGPNMPWTGSEDCTITAGVNRVQTSLFNNDLINPEWRNIDSNQTTGFFATRPSRNAHYVSMAYFDKRVFLLWSERTGSYDHVRVARYVPGYTDYSSRRVYPETWEIVDNGAGLNLDQMRHGRRGSLAVYASRLYAFWNEQDGRAAMIRVKAYDGTAGGTGKLWTEVAWGTPQLKLRSRAVATQPQYLCPYVGGSGTTTLVFRYLVQPGDASADLDVFDANSLIMYDGSIEYIGSASSVADLSFARCPTLADSKNIVIDTAAPTVTKVTSSLPDGNYGAGQDVPIDVEFSAPVSVSGVPRMRMMVTTTDRLEDNCGWQSGHNSEYCRERFAYYSAGAGTNVLTFVYQVQLGQSGISYAGINHANMIGHAPGSDRTWDLTYDGPGAVTHYLNGTAVKRLATTPVTDAVLTLPQTNAATALKMLKNIVLDTKQTRVESVDTAVPAGTYGVGEEIDIVVTFTHNVSVHFSRSRRTGSHFIPPANVSDPTDLVPPQDTPPAMQFVPYLVMETGALDRRAPYVSGNGTNSLTFRYVVEEGDTSAKLDVLDTRHKLVQQQVSTALRLPDGCGIRRWSTHPVHDVDLTLAAPGDAGSISHTKTIVIDSQPPVITRVTSLKADGTYGVGEIIDIDVFFSRRVKVTGVPVLQLDTGGKHRLPLGDDEYLNNLQTGKIHWNSATSSYTDADSYYVSGSGTNKLTFRYRVRFADVTPMLDYASTHALRLNTRWDEVGEGNMGTINSYATHSTQPASLTLPARGTRPATIVGPFSIASSGNRIAIRTDGAGPTAVTADVPDDVYGVGQEIFIVVHFREPVTVTGTPHLVMAIKPGMAHDPSVVLQYPAVGTNGEGIPRPVYGAVAGVEYAAPFVSGSGTKELRFKYVVGADHKSAALEYTLPTIMRESQIILSGGATITDSLGSVPLGMPPPGGVSLRGASLSKSKNIVVDGSAPYVKSVTTVAPDGVYGVGETIDVSVIFDRKVVVVTPPSLLMETGATDRAAAYVSGSGGYSLLFRYVVQDNDRSFDLNYQSEAALTCTAVSTSLNKVAAQAAQKPELAVVGSSLYAVWVEASAAAPGNTQVRAAVYSGNDTLPSWGAVHNSLDPPLNKVAAQVAAEAHAAALGSKLYVTWAEASAGGGIPQVRVAEFAGAAAVAPWVFVDGDGAVGLNVDTSKAASEPHLVACRSKLYVLWSEEDKIRLRVYGGGGTWTSINGQSPVPAGPQLNRATAEKASSPRAVCRNNALYITWVEEHLTVGQIRVLRYNADEAAKQFKWVDGRGRQCVCDTLLSVECCLPATAPENSATGLNWDTTKTARAPDLVEFAGTLYAAWSETDGTVDHARLAKFNADDGSGGSRPRWPFVDGNLVAGMNVAAAHDARRPRLAVHTDAENAKRLVVAWEEANDVPATQTKTRLRATTYNGTVFVAQHLPEPPDGGAAYLSLQPMGTRLYGAWQVAHGPTSPHNTFVYAGAYVDRGGWRHASDACIKLQATTPTVPAHLTLPPATAGAGSLSSAHAIVIDSDAPTVTRVTSSTRDGMYSLGDAVDIGVTFSDPVVVQSGVPTLHLDTSGGADRRATYSSGSGTKDLRFRYTVGAGDAAGDLSYATTTSLVGQIMRRSSTPVKLADLTLPRRGSQQSLGRAASVVVGMVPPIVLTVNSSVPDGTYGTGAAIPITVTFDREVFVTGAPSLKLALSEKVPTPAPTPALSCASLQLAARGAPTVYDWAVQPHRVPSTDGTAYNWTNNNVSWHAVFGVDNHPFVSCHTEQRPEAPNGVLHALPSNTLTIRSNGIPDHNVGRFPMDHPGGTVGRASLDNPHRIRPQQLQVEIPSNPVTRTDAATAKSLRDDPTKALPGGGAAIGVAVNGVPIHRATDALGQDVVSPSSAGYQVTDLCGGRTQSDGAYYYTHRLDCVREDVAGQHSPLLGWALDGYPIYGMHGDGGVPPTDLDQCNGRVHPSKGYVYHVTKAFPYTLGCFRGQICDRLRPGLCPGAPPAAVQRYAAKHVPAAYTAGSGTAVLSFSYVVAAGESTARLDYSDQVALELGPGGAIKDENGLAAALTLLPPGTQVVPPAFTPPVGPGGLDHMAPLHKTGARATPTRTSLGWNKAIVIDTEPPRVLRVFSVPSIDTYETSVTYGAGQLVHINVLFDMPVAVAGSPRLWLETGAVDREALYLRGSGTANLTFAYVVQAGDTSAGLDYKRTCKEHEYNPVAWDCIEYGKSALYAPAGTTIRRLSDSPATDAILELPHPGVNDGATPRGCTDVDRDVLDPTCTASGSGSPWSAQRGSLAFHSSIVIDTTPPFARAVRSSKMPGVLVPGDVVDVQVVFNYPVKVTGVPRLRMQTGHGAFASPLQTVDVSAPSAISAGGFKLKYGSLETACIDWNAAGEATDGSSVKEKLEAMGAGVMKVGVKKDLAHATNGHRYVVTFSSPTASIQPLVPSLAGCTAFNPTTADVSANGYQYAYYNADWSEGAVVTFLYTVTEQDKVDDVSHHSINALDLVGGTASIKRLSTTPTTDVLTSLPEPRKEIDHHTGAAWKMAPSTRLGEHSQTIQSVELVIRKLHHEHASDLRVELQHGGKKALVFDQVGAAKTFGRPREHPHPDDPSPAGYDFAPENPVVGDGFDYVFRDIEGTNLALAGHATQSSTGYDGVARRAIDGSTNGRYSALSTTHTGGHGEGDAEPWWQVRLGIDDTTPVGTVKLWGREQEDNVNEVQIVQTTTLQVVSDSLASYGPARGPTIRTCASLAGGRSFAGTGALHERMTDEGTTKCGDDTFRLTVPFGGLGSTPCDTGLIHYSAVAEIADEDAPSDPLGLAGARPGESVQAKLQACPNVGQVRVRRSPADSSGGYQWVITFVGAPGNLDLVAVKENNLKVPGATVRTMTVQDGNDNKFYNYAGKRAELEGRIAPTGCDAMGTKCEAAWIMVLPSSFAGVANSGSLAVAKRHALWKKRVTSNKREQSFSLPLSGVWGARFVRVQLEGKGYLSIAEVQVFEALNRPLKEYAGGSPISATSFPGGLPYAPEESFNEAFRGMSAEGDWQLVVNDLKPRQVTNLDSSKARRKPHGMGGLSDWVLRVTDASGDVLEYYMDIDAQVQTLPKYGNLYVGLTEAEAQYLDRDANGHLDREEARQYCLHYVREFHRMDVPSQKLILDRFMADYELQDAVRIQEEEGLQRYLSSCYGPVTDTYNIFRMDGQNDNMLRSTCRDQFGVGNRLSTNVEGAVARKNHVVRRQRTVRYVPIEGYKGEDSFTFKVRLGQKMSEARGTVKLGVRVCRGYDECGEDDWAFHQHQRHSRNGPET